MTPPCQSEEMQQQAVEVASEAMEKHSVEKDIAMYIKKEVRRDSSPTQASIRESIDTQPVESSQLKR